MSSFYFDFENVDSLEVKEDSSDNAFFFKTQRVIIERRLQQRKIESLLQRRNKKWNLKQKIQTKMVRI